MKTSFIGLLVLLALVSVLRAELRERDSEEAEHVTPQTLHEQRLQRMKRERKTESIKRNSLGHRVLERFDNGSSTLEVESDGETGDDDGQGGIRRRRLTTTDAITATIAADSNLILTHDPPDGAMTPHAMGVYVYCTEESARIYYETDGAASVSLSSAYATRTAPYIHIGPVFGATRERTLAIVCVFQDNDGTYTRSNQIELNYIVETDARPLAYGFLVPGVESDGYFLKFVIEQKAAARAQVAGGQEFADFYTYLGIGPYVTPRQIFHMKLNDLMDDMNGFEGGMTVNCTNGKQYGILVPNHNGQKFTGVVVRVDLEAMDEAGTCIDSWVHETKDSGGTITKAYDASTTDVNNPCVHSLALTDLHPDARGFRRGFANQPYVYLSPGEFNIPVRLDVCDFGLATTEVIDLSGVRDDTLGGYSGGFADGNWACFNPFRTFVGPFGGVRSADPVDNGHLRPYYHGMVLCIYHDAWTATTDADIEDNIRTFDLSLIHSGLRGFSEAVKVGRYAYLSPMSERPNAYSFRLVRIYLGTTDIGETLEAITDSSGEIVGGALRDIIDVMDLKQVDSGLAGFSGIFYSGKYLFLVPYRSENTRASGLRGHGKVVRIDMNIFDVAGTSVIDLTTTTRNQIPSFADEDLRGFSGGFASGKYCLFVPFYNALFSGKMARLVGLDDDMTNDVQVLNIVQDTGYPDLWKGYRSGFVSLWQGATNEG